MASIQKEEGKNELVRHLLATLVYRTTKIIKDTPENYARAVHVYFQTRNGF
jgi:hypothetical protein